MTLVAVLALSGLVAVLLHLFDRWIPLSDPTKKYIGMAVTTGLLLFVALWAFRSWVP